MQRGRGIATETPTPKTTMESNRNIPFIVNMSEMRPQPLVLLFGFIL